MTTTTSYSTCGSSETGEHGYAEEDPKRDPAIDEYLSRTSVSNRALLRELRKTIHALVPEVEECISYRMPAFRYDGVIIAGFAARSSSCSFYPFSGRTLKTLAKDVAGYSQTKSALHFSAEKPLPASLVRKLLDARMATLTFLRRFYDAGERSRTKMSGWHVTRVETPSRRRSLRSVDSDRRSASASRRR
jgi:uncharacterized protein YdhG (YjbR/CyaY superfamily)